ncbi:MAG: hypothetical protein QXY15_11070 [Candidatus Nitrosotenuis sp.]
MVSEEEKFDKAIKVVTPKAADWANDVINSINALDIDENGKDAMLTWVLELLLFHTPYPNRIIINTLSKIITHVSQEHALGFLSWEKRRSIFTNTSSKDALPFEYEDTEEGLVIYGCGTVISATESNSLIQRYRTFMPKFIKQETRPRKTKADVLESANLDSSFKACVELYKTMPDEDELKSLDTELSRKFELFWRYTTHIEMQKFQKKNLK